jgi:deazaflavin-dependent oxidoreductase (nitroreductase family)
VTDYNRRTVEEFRANGGQVGGVLAGTPLVLIHHIGARSGIEHVTPLAYLAQADGIAIAASNGGSPNHPAWYHNLKANPAITVEQGTERFQATAEEQAGQARAHLWSKLVAQFPDLAKHAAATGRTIPIFLLLRRATPQPKDQLHTHLERTVPSALPPNCPLPGRTSPSGARPRSDAPCLTPNRAAR